jgi:hypothetical protein
MLHVKTNKITLSLLFCGLFALLSPGLTQAEPYETGDIAAGRAAEQRAAIAKRVERIKKEKEAEAKKAAEAQQAKPAEAQQPAEVQQPAAAQQPTEAAKEKAASQ